MGFHSLSCLAWNSPPRAYDIKDADWAIVIGGKAPGDVIPDAIKRAALPRAGETK